MLFAVQRNIPEHLCGLTLQPATRTTVYEKLKEVIDFLAKTKNISVISILLILNPNHSSYWEENLSQPKPGQHLSMTLFVYHNQIDSYPETKNFQHYRSEFKKHNKEACTHSDCQHSILTKDRRNAMNSTILEEFANPQRMCEAGIMKIGYDLSTLCKHKPKGL